VVTFSTADLEAAIHRAESASNGRFALNAKPLLSGNQRGKPLGVLSPTSALSPGAQQLLIGHPYHLIDADLADRLLSQLLVDLEAGLLWLTFSDATLQVVRERDQVIAAAFDPGDGLDPNGGMWVQLDATGKHIWAGRTWGRLELPALPPETSTPRSAPTPLRLLAVLFVLTALVIAGSYLWSRK
jgi:hypothetical protein